MTDIVFMDTETLGLDPLAPVWEFAAIRRWADGSESTYQCFIDHDPDPWLGTLPAQFREDYRDRYATGDALTSYWAASKICDFTHGAHIIGAVPSFDTIRLTRLLGRHDPHPSWHYHLMDIENLAVGYLAGQGIGCDLPYRSDELSIALGVNPKDYKRHTAMGDVLWVRDQWDAIMGKQSG